MNKELNEILARLDQIENRSNEIMATIATAEGEELRALDAETKTLATERAELMKKKAELEARQEEATKIQTGETRAEVLKTPREERGTNMDINEAINKVKDSPRYMEAYARYIKTGSDAECRAILKAEGLENRAVESTNALLTDNAGAGNNSLPTPTVVEETIKTAWDNEPIMSRVHSVEVKGNLAIGFEFSSTDAVAKKEGEKAAEGKIELGTVKLTPESLMKWVRTSAEAVDLDGEKFLQFIYDALAHKVAKLAADTVVKKINAAPAVATKTAPSVAEVESTGIADFVNAISKLSDEANDPVIIMNKQSYAYYKNLVLAANYSIDPFEGCDVLFNNSLPVADGKTEGTYAIVGDLGYGLEANFPNGKDITFKFDDLTEAESGLIKIVGRTPAAIEVTADKAFCKIVKKAA